jgi:uncharacterized membrane-anchored protein
MYHSPMVSGPRLTSARSTRPAPPLLKVPEIFVYFWIIKLLTTALGEATSDFLVFQINPYVAVVLACLGLLIALVAQIVAPRFNAWFYWVAVAMVAVFGTMAADVLHVVLHIPYAVSTVFFAAALAVVFIVWYRSEGTLSIHTIVPGRRELFYWATVMATFALGTAAGDLTASTFHLGYFGSILLFAVLFAIPAVGYRFFSWDPVFAFWFAYVITRPLGASIADWLGKPYLGGLGLGDAQVALVMIAIFLVLVAYIAVRGIGTPRQVTARTN